MVFPGTGCCCRGKCLREVWPWINHHWPLALQKTCSSLADMNQSSCLPFWCLMGRLAMKINMIIIRTSRFTSTYNTGGFSVSSSLHSWPWNQTKQKGMPGETKYFGMVVFGACSHHLIDHRSHSKVFCKRMWYSFNRNLFSGIMLLLWLSVKVTRGKVETYVINWLSKGSCSLEFAIPE